MDINKIILGDCREVLKTLPDNSIDCCVSSPPYFNLRNYNHKDQIGQEATPDEYAKKLCSVFAEVRRVMKPSGTLWLNIADSWAGSNGTGGKQGDKQFTNVGSRRKAVDWKKVPYKAKDQMLIQFEVAKALLIEGWYLRDTIIWAKAISGELQKGTTMPESVTDRCTKAHEYIFMLSKSKRYYYNAKAIQEKCLQSDSTVRDRSENKINNGTGLRAHGNLLTNNYEYKNKRSVWHYGPPQFDEAHFATFPEDLIVDCIKAGCPENGIVLDPFSGAGTTALVASKLNRNYIGIELNQSYIDITNKRLQKELGMFNKAS